MASLAFGLGALPLARDAEACGPCGAPELTQVEMIAGEPVLVSNFGLMAADETGWRLTCEEKIGGLLLDVRTIDEAGLVSTDLGLFTQAGGLCEWGAGPAIASNDWLFSFSTPALESGASQTKLGLVIGVEPSGILVERSESAEDFTVIHSFDSASGYNDIEAGDAASLFVSGYTFDPRTWNVAFSLDAGETWDEVSPNVENETSTMYLRLVDPQQPRAVFVEANTLVGQPDELWRFDAETAEAERVLTLDGEELFGGMAIDGDTIWVAGRHRDGGSLYRADRQQLEFARVVDTGPEFSCLAAFDGVLYACVNNFTYSSEFILGSSTDDGQTWSPLMTLDDLGAIESCGDECSATVDWLHGAYGILEDGAGGSDGASGDGSPEPSGGKSGCQFAVASPAGRSSSDSWAWIGALLGFLALRRRDRGLELRPRRTSARALAVVSLALAAAACSGDDGEMDMDTGPHCGGRGDDLVDLEVSASDGSTLSFVDYTPDPPVVGDNSWLVGLSDADGGPLTGMAESIVVTPFMPDHGHGTPVSVGVIEEGSGQYRLAPVNTFMPGLWQISLELMLADDTTELFEFSVCVE